MMRLSRSAALRTVCGGIAAACVATVAVGGVAAADPEELDAVRARVAEVSGQVDELYRKAGAANDRYLQAQERLAETTKSLESAKAAVERQEALVDKMTTEMGGFAAAAYRQGVIDPTLHLVLSDTPSEALTQSALVDAFADQQASALTSVASERDELAQKKADVDEEAAALEDIEADLASEKATLDSSVEEAEALLASLKDEEREIMAEIERERAEAAARAAEQARQAALAAASRDEQRTATTQNGTGQPTTQRQTTGQQGTAAQGTGQSPQAQPAPAAPAAPSPAGSGGAAAAVAFALAQLGDSYAYGGRGPNAWDCSGLTSGAWAAAGVSIPRTSQGQLYGMSRVSMNALQPGDIVAYYGGASHVGIYIGNGQIVHSSRPGRPVSIAGVYSMPVAGAARP